MNNTSLEKVITMAINYHCSSNHCPGKGKHILTSVDPGHRSHSGGAKVGTHICLTPKSVLLTLNYNLYYRYVQAKLHLDLQMLVATY